MNRKEAIEHLQQTNCFDVLIIGGGATGLGMAVDAASRGLSTLLLEQSDFAKGSSSRSTKLVHGGVRYLAQGNIRLVREALIERGNLLRNAPHVCHRLAFIVPTYSRWQKLYYRIGLWCYEWMSGKLSLGKTSLLSKKETLQHLPDLADHKLRGGILYYDGQFDDSRMAILLAQTATAQGASVLNYFSVKGFKKQNNLITAVIARDELTMQEFEIAAKVFINATGVFADAVLQLSEEKFVQTIRPSQGIHLVLNRQFFKGDTALMIPATDDGRVLFAIPWQNQLLIGTTDTPVQEICTDPIALEQEIDFVIRHFNKYACTKIAREDVLSVFAGLRPLAMQGAGKKTSLLPRDHVIKQMPSGLIHVTGGKWTTYRLMAAQTIDLAMRAAGLPFSPCTTKHLRLHGWTHNKTANHLDQYGTAAIAIKKMYEQDSRLSEKIHSLYPWTKAEVIWMMQEEMAETVEDILARRTRLLFLNAHAAMEATPLVANWMAAYKNYDEEWVQNQITLMNTLIKNIYSIKM